MFIPLYVSGMLGLTTYAVIWRAVGELMPLWLRIFVTAVIGLGLVLILAQSIIKIKADNLIGGKG